jgi:hypothetical protein
MAAADSKKTAETEKEQSFDIGIRANGERFAEFDAKPSYSAEFGYSGLTYKIRDDRIVYKATLHAIGKGWDASKSVMKFNPPASKTEKSQNNGGVFDMRSDLLNQMPVYFPVAPEYLVMHFVTTGDKPYIVSAELNCENEPKLGHGFHLRLYYRAANKA